MLRREKKITAIGIYVNNSTKLSLMKKNLIIDLAKSIYHTLGTWNKKIGYSMLSLLYTKTSRETAS